jgi:hypothetical protein
VALSASAVSAYRSRVSRRGAVRRLTARALKQGNMSRGQARSFLRQMSGRSAPVRRLGAGSVRRRDSKGRFA